MNLCLIKLRATVETFIWSIIVKSMIKILSMLNSNKKWICTFNFLSSCFLLCCCVSCFFFFILIHLFIYLFHCTSGPLYFHSLSDSFGHFLVHQVSQTPPTITLEEALQENRNLHWHIINSLVCRRSGICRVFIFCFSDLSWRCCCCLWSSRRVRKKKNSFYYLISCLLLLRHDTCKIHIKINRNLWLLKLNIDVD